MEVYDFLEYRLEIGEDIVLRRLVGKYPMSEVAQVEVGGYSMVHVAGKLRTLHGLVAELALGPRPEGHVINHIDGHKGNNHPSNLEYVTMARNMEHAHELGLSAVGCTGEGNLNYRHGQSATQAYKNAVNRKWRASRKHKE